MIHDIVYNMGSIINRARDGFGYGHQTVEDGIIKDGLWDVYNQVYRFFMFGR